MLTGYIVNLDGAERNLGGTLKAPDRARRRSR